MNKSGITMAALGALASVLIASETAEATGNPSYTNVVRTPSCTGGSNGLTVCNSATDYALKASNNRFIFYTTNVYYSVATVITGSPSPSSTSYLLALAAGCSGAGTQPVSSGTVNGGASSRTVFCNSSGQNRSLVNALAQVRIN